MTRFKNREVHEVFALFEDEIEELKKNPKKLWNNILTFFKKNLKKL